MLIQDLRFAWRLARRQPLISLAAVLTIAFGVGANTAIVSVLESVLLNPAGLRHADRITIARVNVESVHLKNAQTSAVEFREIQAMTDAFAATAAMQGQYWTAEFGGEPVRILGPQVTADFFRVFGADPALGAFPAAGDRDGVVLSYNFWRTQFGGDRSVVGRALVLDGKIHRITGVAAANFHFPANAQVWTPLVLEAWRFRRGYNMNLWVFERLKDGVSVTQAADRVTRYVQALKSGPDGAGWAKSGYGVVIDPVGNFVAGDLRRPLWLLFAAALVVLLTGCANVAGLLLSRASGRRREMAIRISIGATGRQIVRQLLIESVVLGALGGICGLGLAAGAMPIITRLSIPGRQWLTLVALDRRMLVYGFGLALASGLVFGLAPALQVLRESQGAAMARSRRRWFQDVFVIAEVAGSFVLVVMTLLLLRSLWSVERIRPGFDPSHLTTAFVMKPSNDPGFLDRLRGTLGAEPGVESAAISYPVPFAGGELTSGFSIRGRQQQPGEPEWHGEAYMVTPEYLATLRIPLLRGRNLSESDAPKAPLVCLIDAKFAQRFFPNQDPIGQEIEMYGGAARIVGIVGTIRGSTLEDGSRPVAYYSMAQIPLFANVGVVVRSRVSAGAAVREAIRRANPRVPLFDMQAMEDRIGQSLGIRRVVAWLLLVFGAISLLLAAIGIYGVVAQVVSERTGEIGVRMALGARPGQILAQFAGQGLKAGMVGIAAGLGFAVYAQRWVAGMLYETRPFDLIAFGSAGLGVLALLVVSVWWPARRAARIDPMRALRYE